jgi:cytochrome c oxidase cbb3-type subunit 3
MAGFQKDGILAAAQVQDVAAYVLSLSQPAVDGAAVERGAAVFAEQCVACHQQGGVGSRELGAPDLADSVWLYGGTKAAIVESISYGRGGVMPAWEGRLSPATLKLLAVYVHDLGGGE